MQEVDPNDEEEDLTVTHKKHLRFCGIRWRYIRMSIAVVISMCFAAAGIVLYKKQKGFVSFCYTARPALCIMADCNACSVHL